MKFSLELFSMILALEMLTIQTLSTLSKRQAKLDGYGFNLIGALFSGSSIVLWDKTYGDRNSTNFKEIEEFLCKYLKVLAGVNGLKTKLCRMAQLSEAKTSLGSYTNVYIQLLTNLTSPEKNQISDRDEARENLMQGLGWLANMGMAKYYIGVKQESKFSPGEIVVYQTADDEVSIAWPLKPMDCSMIYRVDYRPKDKPLEVKTSQEMCENSYGPIKIKDSVTNEYRVSLKPSTETDFTQTSDWISTVTTKKAYPMMISGNVRTIGDIPYPYIPEMSDLKSSSGSLIASSVCNSAQILALSQEIIPIACRTLNINRDKNDETTATIQLDVVSSAENKTRVNKVLEEVFLKTSQQSPNDTNKLNYFLGNNLLVDKSYGKDINLGYASETTQNISWPEYPTDCSYTYLVKYRRKNNATILTEDAGCENSIKIMNLEKGEEYQYQLTAMKDNVNVTLPWTEFKQTLVQSNCPMECILAASICTVVGVSALACLGMYLLNRHNNKKVKEATKTMLSDLSRHFSSSAVRDSFNENQTGRYKDLRIPQRPVTPKMTRRLKDLIHRVS